MVKVFNFDMDGTLCATYAIKDWLEKLRSYDPSPYMEARPLLRLSTLAYYINKAQRNGWQVNVVSWLSKCSTSSYDEAVTEAKKEWLKKHLPSVQFDKVIIVPYGTPKHDLAKGVLFDDEAPNREKWNSANNSNQAFDACDILQVMRDLIE